tara:strand:+ start:1546 stop:1839 length:294 start_codon:yes stop_codon:yes gene_type:complete
MAIDTIPLRKIEELTSDLYEATAVMSTRAKQVIADRTIEREMDAAMVEPELLDEVQPDIQDYEEKDKPTTVALIEFLNSELRWEYDKPLDEDEESTV